MKTSKHQSLNNKFLLFPFVLVFLEIITFLSTDMYLPALPLVAEDFKVSQELAQYTQALWFLGATSMQLFLGPLTEKYGRRRILILGVMLFITASFMCATSNNFYLFAVSRFLQGTTVCAVIVAGYATIHDLYSGTRAVQILAVMGSITILAPALGPLLGALIINYWDWHDIFGILSVSGMFGLLGVYYFMPLDSIDKNIKNIKNKIKIKNIIKDYKEIFGNYNFMRIALINSFVIICFFIWIVASPFIIITNYAQSAMYFGWVQAFVFSGFIFGAQTAKYLVAKISVRNLCDLGLSIVSVALGLFVIFSYFKLNINLIILSMIGIAYGASMLSGLFNRLAIESADKQPMAHRVAAYSMMVSLSASVGSYLVTFISNMVFFNIAILMLFFVVIAVIIYASVRSEIKLRN